jgi:hypothetical protein
MLDLHIFFLTAFENHSVDIRYFVCGTAITVSGIVIAHKNVTEEVQKGTVTF